MNKQFKIFNLKFKTTDGFSLIELLVVISLLSILTSFVLSNIVDTRQRSRDAQRKSDLAKISAALEAYKADSGSYPQRGDGIVCTSSTPANCTIRAAYLSESGDSASLSRYILEMPKDPGRTATGNTCDSSGAGNLDYVYRYNASSQKYILFTKLESTTDSDATKPKVAPADVGLDAGGDSCVAAGTGCKTYKIGVGSCTNVVFNYWIVNP